MALASQENLIRWGSPKITPNLGGDCAIYNYSQTTIPYGSTYLRKYLDPPNLRNSVSNHLLRRCLDPSSYRFDLAVQFHHRTSDPFHPDPPLVHLRFLATRRDAGCGFLHPKGVQETHQRPCRMKTCELRLSRWFR